MTDKLHEYETMLAGCKLVRNAPMREYTSFRIGGPADIMLFPKNARELIGGMSAAKKLGLPCCVIGNGSNLLVSDDGVEGVVIRIVGELTGIEYTNDRLKVMAGTLMSTAAKDSVEHGLQGLEWAAGIPGSVGGAVAMNAGAYGGEIKQTLCRIECVKNGELCEVTPQDGDLGYRFSRFCAPDIIVISAEFSLSADDGGAKERMREFTERRRTKQPLTYPSAGSTFKRPEGNFAGALIEGAGLKGTRVGGAEVSKLHAGFIINTGDATCRDVRTLIELVQEKVLKISGIRLEPEVKFIGR